MKKRGARASSNNKGIILKDNHLILISFTVITLVKIILSLPFYSPFIVKDELIYNDLSRRILEGQFFSTMGGYPPGYPLLLSMINLVSADQAVLYHLMLCISAIVSTSIIFPAYLLLKQYANERIALPGAIAVTILPAVTYYSFTLMSENLFIPLFFWTVIAVIKGIGEGSRKWQVLGGALLTYLYMTRSIGLAMIVASLVVYAVNFWQNKTQSSIVTLKNTSPFLFSLSFFTISWIIFSTVSPVVTVARLTIALIYIVICAIISIAAYFAVQRLPDHIPRKKLLASPIFLACFLMLVSILLVSSATGYLSAPFPGSFQESGQYSGGNSYDIVKNLRNISGYLLANPFFTFEIVANHLDYLLIASFFTVPSILIHTGFRFRAEQKTLQELNIGNLYVIITLVLTFAIAVIYTFEYDLFGNEGHVVLGRYFEPIVPVLIVIMLSKISHASTKQAYSQFIAMSSVGLLFILATSLQDLNIYMAFSDVANNPSTLWLQSFYPTGIPWLALGFFGSLIIVAIGLSIKNHELAIWAVVIIITYSLIISAILYSDGLQSSNYRKGNDISQYLNTYSNTGTLLIIDCDMTNREQLAAFAVYSFWNSGDTSYSKESADSRNGQKWLISTNMYNNTTLARDSNFILYLV